MLIIVAFFSTFISNYKKSKPIVLQFIFYSYSVSIEAKLRQDK